MMSSRIRFASLRSGPTGVIDVSSRLDRLCRLHRRQQIQDERSIDGGVSLVAMAVHLGSRDSLLVSPTVIDERALKVSLLSVHLPFPLVDRTCDGKRFLW